MFKSNKVKVKGISGCPLLWRRCKGRRDWKRGVATDESGRAGHYIHQLIAAYHTYVACSYKQLELDTAMLYQMSSEMAQDYYSKRQQLAEISEGGCGGATDNIRLRNAARSAGHCADLSARIADIQNQLVGIDEELLHAENEVAARCREAALLTEKHIRAYLHGASRAAAYPVKAEYRLAPPFDAAADFAARHRESNELRRAVIRAEWERGDVV